MSVDMFLDLADCKGESIAVGFKDQIDILSWNWGMSNQGSANIGGGSGTGKASFRDLNFKKFVDLATPTIMANCASGKHFQQATLTCRKAGGNQPVKYLQIEMFQAFVSGVHHNGDPLEDKTIEEFTLNFSEVHVIYKPQGKDGSDAGDVPFKWDIRKNSSV